MTTKDTSLEDGPQDKPHLSLGVEEDEAANETIKADEGEAAPDEVDNPDDGTKSKRPKGLYIALGVAAVVIVALCAVLASVFLADEGVSSRDPNALLGQLEGKSEEEIQAELDRIVEEGMFNVSISSIIEFEDGTSEGNLCIENVPGNLYLMQVDITRDDTGELLYKTGLIDPNHHIQSDSLEIDLDAGEYACTATFNAHDAETEELVGQAAVKITIKVLG